MKVLDLCCANGHRFEGWFASDEDYQSQNGRGLVECPICADTGVKRLPSAPRLNLSGASAPAPMQQAAPAADDDGARQRQAAWLAGVRELMRRTEDVGERFADEARRIHYGEVPQRGIRGQATPEQREALREEGIETMSIPVPRGLDEPLN